MSKKDSIKEFKRILHKFKKPQFILLFFLIIGACLSDLEGDTNISKIEPESSNFVGSTVCKSCHQDQYTDWKESHHDQAMKVADSISVLGDFNDVSFSSNGVKSSFYKKEDDFFVNTQGDDGNYQDYKIVYTFGVTPLQQYIVQFPDGKYQCLQTAWDSEKNKWFDLQPNLEIEHDEWIHWTGGAMTWNSSCADCHSTNLDKGFDSQLNSYNTTFSEINVSCEACHGPGSQHADFYQNPNPNVEPAKMYMDSSLISTEVVDKCARCHSRRSQITSVFDFKGEFLDHYSPSLLIDPIYEMDGQIRDEDYVYGSFVQSKMYHNGVSCRDCHNVHSLKLQKTGNSLCLNCHEPKYDSESHHFHKVESEGGQCVNCHMTGKTYMGNDFRRDHSFRIPRPDQSVTYGTPNACNGCHSDESPEWARDFIVSKYGKERVDHFSDHLLAGYQGDQAALLKLLKGEKYPDIARATALNIFSNQQLSMQEVNSISKFLNDSSALIRNEAINTIRNLESREFSKFIEPLLLDSIRLVRLSAAGYFHTIGASSEFENNYGGVQKEYLDKLEINSDFPSGQHEIALYHHARGDVSAAVQAYEKSISIDNHFNTSRMNLALLYYQQGDVEEAKNLYLTVIKQEPEFSHSYYMLGLLYNEVGEPEKALDYLAKACEREPVNIRAFYNYSLKLQQAGKYKESIEIIERALEMIPNNEEFLYVKLLGQFNGKQFKEARTTCELLLKISPNNSSYLQILTQLQGQF
jgi:tetratricopeptide (TPR) repeat protein